MSIVVWKGLLTEYMDMNNLESMDGHLSVCVRVSVQSLFPALAWQCESDFILAGVRSGEKGDFTFSYDHSVFEQGLL